MGWLLEIVAWMLRPLSKRPPDVAPPRGFVNFGNVRRTEPISQHFGFDRGLGIDRYYIERFLAQHAADMKGHVLEIGDDQYSRKFGGWNTDNNSPIQTVDILHVTGENPNTTIVADLTDGHGLEDESFDCIICVQTLQFIYATRAGIATLWRILRPGGTLLVTASGISQLSRFDVDRWGEYWRFTHLSLARMLGERFGEPNVEVEAHGNVLSAIAFLHGLCSEELRTAELEHHDPNFELLLTARAVKSE